MRVVVGGVVLWALVIFPLGVIVGRILKGRRLELEAQELAWRCPDYIEDTGA